MSHQEASQGVRIQKVIAQAGVASRRKAEEMIEAGLVKVNGQTAQLGQKMQIGVDYLEVDGQKIKLQAKQRRLVYALYKPKNCLTTMDDPRGRPTVKDFFPNIKERLFPVGRLDYDTEGLLLITNDGDLAQKVTHPKHKLWKTYFVKVKGHLTTEELHQLRVGLVIERKKTLPAKVKILHRVNDKTWLDVSIREGRNQQIKKMFKTLGHPVSKIKRYRIGNITLGEMTAGMSRLLSPQEVAQLIKE